MQKMKDLSDLEIEDVLTPRLLLTLGVLQAVVVFMQTVFLPQYGVWGAIFAAQVLLCPWIIKVARLSRQVAISMSLASALTTPFLSASCRIFFEDINLFGMGA